MLAPNELSEIMARSLLDASLQIDCSRACSMFEYFVSFISYLRPHPWYLLSGTANSTSICPLPPLQPDEQRRCFRPVDGHPSSKIDASKRGSFTEFSERKRPLVYRWWSVPERNVRICRP